MIKRFQSAVPDLLPGRGALAHLPSRKPYKKFKSAPIVGHLLISPTFQGTCERLV